MIVVYPAGFDAGANSETARSCLVMIAEDSTRFGAGANSETAGGRLVMVHINAAGFDIRFDFHLLC